MLGNQNTNVFLGLRMRALSSPRSMRLLPSTMNTSRPRAKWAKARRRRRPRLKACGQHGNTPLIMTTDNPVNARSTRTICLGLRDGRVYQLFCGISEVITVWVMLSVSFRSFSFLIFSGKGHGVILFRVAGGIDVEWLQSAFQRQNSSEGVEGCTFLLTPSAG